MRLPLLTPQFFLAVQEAIAGSTPGLGVAYTSTEWRWAMAISDRLAIRTPSWAIYTPSHWSLAQAVADQVSGVNNIQVLYSPSEQAVAKIIAAINMTQVYDTKIIGGGSGAGTSLGAIAQDYILFDNNQSGGGNAATMNVFVNGTQVAAFNYGDTAYNSRPFAYFNSANSTLYTGTIAATVNF